MSTTTISLDELVDSSTKDLAGEVSCYKAIKVLNTILEEFQVAPKPTQMGYNYNRNGMLGVKGTNKVSVEDLKIWIKKYVTRNVLAK